MDVEVHQGGGRESLLTLISCLAIANSARIHPHRPHSALPLQPLNVPKELRLISSAVWAGVDPKRKP